ncbi:hypothetical protein IWZ01DRAFT_237979 [Phyllosticta capitalensis]
MAAQRSSRRGRGQGPLSPTEAHPRAHQTTAQRPWNNFRRRRRGSLIISQHLVVFFLCRRAQVVGSGETTSKKRQVMAARPAASVSRRRGQHTPEPRPPLVVLLGPLCLVGETASPRPNPSWFVSPRTSSGMPHGRPPPPLLPYLATSYPLPPSIGPWPRISCQVPAPTLLPVPPPACRHHLQRSWSGAGGSLLRQGLLDRYPP